MSEYQIKKIAVDVLCSSLVLLNPAQKSQIVENYFCKGINLNDGKWQKQQEKAIKQSLTWEK